MAEFMLASMGLLDRRIFTAICAIKYKIIDFLRCLFLIVLISRQDKTSEDDFSEMTFSVDTMIIDPGDEVIFLKYGLINSDISKTANAFLILMRMTNTIEKINLDVLRLEAKLPFEKEGPNGTGSGGVMRVYDANHVTITDHAQIGLFSLEGKKLKTIYLENFL